MTAQLLARPASRLLVLCALALSVQGILVSRAEALVSVPTGASLPASIPDGSGFVDIPFDVSDVPAGAPRDVTVIVGLQHPNVGDLSVELIAPNGAQQSIFAGVDGDSSNLDGRYVFTNRAPATPTFWQAAGDTSNDAVITPDRYRASIPLGSPNQGENRTIDFPTVTNPNGVWKLRVTDTTSVYGGAVSFARLNFQPAEEAADASTLGAIPDGTATGVEHYGAPRDVSFSYAGLGDGAPSDVAVGMTFSPAHTYAGDLDVVLIAPDGTRGTVFSRTGAPSASASGSAADLAGPYRFSDSAQTATSWWQAAQAAGSNSAISTGSYRASQAGGTGSTGAATSLTAQFAGVTNPNGVWTLRVRDGSVNDVGGVSAASLKVIGAVDTSAPAAPTLTGTDPGSFSNSNFPVLSGTAEAGSNIRVYTNGNCSGAPQVVTVATNAGQFSIQTQVPGDATTSLSVTAYDSSGNLSPCSNALIYVEDSTPPAPPTLATVSTPVNDNHPMFRGSGAETSSTIRIYANQGSPGCTGLPIQLGSGEDFNGAGIQVLMPDDLAYKITVSAVDTAGNESACSNAIDFEEDSSILPPTITGSLPDLRANDNKPTIFGGAEEDVVQVDLYKGQCSGQPVATGTPAKFSNPGLKASVTDDSETNFFAVATDDAGNVSGCSDLFTYVEDSTAPKVKVLAKPKRTVATKAAKAKFKIKFEADLGGAQRARRGKRGELSQSGFRCKLDKGPFKACNSPFSGKVKAGKHTVLITATDYVGNTQRKPTKVSWKVKRKK